MSRPERAWPVRRAVLPHCSARTAHAKLRTAAPPRGLRSARRGSAARRDCPPGAPHAATRVARLRRVDARAACHAPRRCHQHHVKPRGARFQRESAWSAGCERPAGGLGSQLFCPVRRSVDDTRRLFLAPTAGDSTPGAGAASCGACNSAGASRRGDKGWLPRQSQCRAAHNLSYCAAARTGLQ
jgi:hypothetical protein